MTTRPGRSRGPTSTGSAASHMSRRPDGTGAGQAGATSTPTQFQGKNPLPPVFGGQAARNASPSGQPTKSRGTFGAPSRLGKSFANANRGFQRQHAAHPRAALKDGLLVSVEDASVVNAYHERYEQLKLDRAKERERAIKEGQMADPNQPTSLNQAITPVGTCTSMCPEFERVERIVQKMVDKSEKFLHPSTGSYQNMESKMLKRFRRSAAGYDEQLPSDIRTPNTLLQATNYLIRHIIGGSEPLGVIHKFVWDRTRSIRNDLSVQQLTQADDVKMAVACLERIARFHIVSLHLLSSPANDEPFDHHQEREQLNNTMLSLMYYYDDNRGRISFPNEDEFRAYYVIFSIHDQRPDLEARVQKWPAELRRSLRVQAALELFAAAGNTWEYQGTLDAKRPNAIAQGFYSRFFSLVDSPSVSYLMACVAEIYFNYVRQTAIRSIWKGYCRYPSSQQHKNDEWTVRELTQVLHFDDEEQTISFCQEQDLELAETPNGELYLNWGNRPVDSIEFQPSSIHTFSEKYVERKRAGRSLVAIVLGMNIKEAWNLGMINRDLMIPSVDVQTAFSQASSAEDEALFVGEDEQEAQVPTIVVEEDTSGLSSTTGTPLLELKSQRTTDGPFWPEVRPSNAIFQVPPDQPEAKDFVQHANEIKKTEPGKTFSSLFAPAASLTAAGQLLAKPSAPPPSVFSPFSSLSSEKNSDSSSEYLYVFCTCATDIFALCGSLQSTQAGSQ